MDAEQITMISAYYGAAFIESCLLHKSITVRRSRAIKLLVARASPPALSEQRAELTELKQRLTDAGYSHAKVEIRIARDGRFLHTKLYRLRSKRRQLTLVGSANLSERGFGSNDEILVGISGRHGALDTYVDETWASAEPVEKLSVEQGAPARSFDSLLRAGLLYFQPPRVLPVSVDCFPVSSGRYRGLLEVLRSQSNPLPFTDQSGLTSINCLQLLDIRLSDAHDDDEAASRFRMPTYSIQTVFSFWVPMGYEAKLEGLIEAMAAKRRRELEHAGQSLAEASSGQTAARLRTFFAAVDQRMTQAGRRPLGRDSANDVENRISKKLSSLRHTLGNSLALDRLSRRFIGTPVPELWEDERSKEELKTSFCEYIVSRLNATGRRPAIIAHIASKFSLLNSDDAADTRRKIDAYFERGRTWALDDWPNSDTAH